MKGFCDLHAHSNYSDGTLSPKELVDLAVETNLSAVVLSDHNTTNGLNEFLSYAKNKPIKAIAGTELSTEYLGKEVHILGLFLPESSFEIVQGYVDELIQRKEESNKQLVKNLINAGYDIDYEALKSANKTGNFNRAHVGAQMVKKGYVKSIKQAFDTFLSPERGFYTPPKRLDVFEAIQFLKNLGAVPVLAHPLLNLTKQEIIDLVKSAKALGLCGIETVYSTYTQEMQDFCVSVANEFGLLQSGGSDFHGTNKDGIRLGVGFGNLRIPYDFALKLEELSKN